MDVGIVMAVVAVVVVVVVVVAPFNLAHHCFGKTGPEGTPYFFIVGT